VGGETLNLIVNTRYNERRVTVFTSNYPDIPDETDTNSLLCRIGFRMRSRLHEMCDFLELRGADFRFAPANATDKELLALRRWPRRRAPAASGRCGRRRPARRSASRTPTSSGRGGRAGT